GDRETRSNDGRRSLASSQQLLHRFEPTGLRHLRFEYPVSPPNESLRTNSSLEAHAAATCCVDVARTADLSEVNVTELNEVIDSDADPAFVVDGDIDTGGVTATVHIDD